MNHPLNPNDGSADSGDESVVKLVNLWFAVAVIGLFVFACFYVLKAAVDLFLPIVLAGFLGFLLTPVTRWLKKIGLPNFWAPLVGTLGFFTLLMCLFAALCASLARFQPDLPLYLDHIQERLTPILQAVQKSSPSIDRLGAWLNPGNILQVNIRGPGLSGARSEERAEIFCHSAHCPRACFLPSAVRSPTPQKTRGYDSRGVRETKRRRNRGRD